MYIGMHDLHAGQLLRVVKGWGSYNRIQQKHIRVISGTLVTTTSSTEGIIIWVPDHDNRNVIPYAIGMKLFLPPVESYFEVLHDE